MKENKMKMLIFIISISVSLSNRLDASVDTSKDFALFRTTLGSKYAHSIKISFEFSLIPESKPPITAARAIGLCLSQIKYKMTEPKNVFGKIHDFGFFRLVCVTNLVKITFS